MAKTFDDLNNQIEASGGLLTLKMERLRKADGAGKLGSNVVERISEELGKRGLSHYPNPLPRYQWEAVRVFKLDSIAGKVLSAAATLDHDNDQFLRQAFGPTAESKLSQIRDLILG